MQKKQKLSANIGNLISEDQGPTECPDIVDLDNCELVLSQGCDEYLEHLEDTALSQVASEAEEIDVLSQVILDAEDIANPLHTSSENSEVFSTLGQSLFTNCSNFSIKNVTINIIKK